DTHRFAAGRMTHRGSFRAHGPGHPGTCAVGTRSGHAGTPVTDPDGTAAPASPASRPGHAGTPVTDTDGIQSGLVSVPSEVISATTGKSGAVSGQSVPPSVATMTSSGALSNMSSIAARPRRISVPPPPDADRSTSFSDRARALYTAAST